MIQAHPIPTIMTPTTVQYVDSVIRVYANGFMPPSNVEETYRVTQIPSHTSSMRVHNMQVFLDPDTPITMSAIDMN